MSSVNPVSNYEQSQWMPRRSCCPRLFTPGHYWNSPKGQRECNDMGKFLSRVTNSCIDNPVTRCFSVGVVGCADLTSTLTSKCIKLCAEGSCLDRGCETFCEKLSKVAWRDPLSSSALLAIKEVSLPSTVALVLFSTISTFLDSVTTFKFTDSYSSLINDDSLRALRDLANENAGLSMGVDFLTILPLTFSICSTQSPFFTGMLLTTLGMTAGGLCLSDTASQETFKLENTLLNRTVPKFKKNQTLSVNSQLSVKYLRVAVDEITNWVGKKEEVQDVQDDYDRLKKKPLEFSGFQLAKQAIGNHPLKSAISGGSVLFLLITLILFRFFRIKSQPPISQRTGPAVQTGRV